MWVYKAFMGIKNATYQGYKAYSYLTPDEDYKNYTMSRWDRVGRRKLSLSPEEEDRHLRLAREKIFIAFHEHPVYYPENVVDEAADYKHHGRHFCAYDALAESYIDCVFDNLMAGRNVITSHHGWKWTDVLHDLGMRLCDLAHQDHLVLCLRTEDIIEAHRAGKIAWVACIEGSMPIENELDRIDILYGLGIRMLGITYAESNPLGGGMTALTRDSDPGLTSFGKEAVKRMNKLGMAVDITHSGLRTSLDTVETSDRPVFLSHMGFRWLWEGKRREDSERMMKELAARGGVIGVAAPHLTPANVDMRADLESVMESFLYLIDLVGIDHIAFGIDALYGYHVGLYKAYDKLDGKGVFSNPAFKTHDHIEGLENPTEASWNILRWLVKHGYSDGDIEKVLSGNILKALGRVWK
jgi:membrane dipeptidase